MSDPEKGREARLENALLRLLVAVVTDTTRLPDAVIEATALVPVVCEHCPDFPHPLNDDETPCKRPVPAPGKTPPPARGETYGEYVARKSPAAASTPKLTIEELRKLLDDAVPGAEELGRSLKAVFRPPGDDLILDAGKAPSDPRGASPPAGASATVRHLTDEEQADQDLAMRWANETIPSWRNTYDLIRTIRAREAGACVAIFEKAFEQNWVVQDTVDAIRARASTKP